MHGRTAVVISAAGAAVLTWVFDALIAAFLFHSGPFLQMLILDVPAPKWLARVATLVVFALFGLMVSGRARVRERTPAEESAAEDAELGRFAYEAHTMIVGLDREGRVTFFNRRAEEITGRSRDVVVGQSFFDLMIPPRSLPSMLPAFNAVIEHDRAVTKEAS
ncbi:MAG: PAS domain-containing protein, partial [Armatimonadota bacterium]